MKKCFPKCYKKEPPSAGVAVVVDPQRVCFKCSTAQPVAKDATVFVCTTCRSVNRIGGVLEEVPSSSCSEQIVVSLQRVNSSTFLPVSKNTPLHDAGITTLPALLAPCSICLDAPGDMIFLKCHHGGFCEACARHIAGNNAVGGSCCVKCRCPIDNIVRIVELDEDNAVKAVQVDFDKSGSSKKLFPPKVPAPRGLNKAKKKQH